MYRSIRDSFQSLNAREELRPVICQPPVVYFLALPPTAELRPDMPQGERTCPIPIRMFPNPNRKAGLPTQDRRRLIVGACPITVRLEGTPREKRILPRIPAMRNSTRLAIRAFAPPLPAGAPLPTFLPWTAWTAGGPFGRRGRSLSHVPVHISYDRSFSIGHTYGRWWGRIGEPFRGQAYLLNESSQFLGSRPAKDSLNISRTWAPGGGDRGL